MSLFDSLQLDLSAQRGPVAEDAPKRPLLERDGEGDDYILRIDNSTLETFQACSRASEFQCIERRQKQPSAALAFGGAIHEGLEVLYRDGFVNLPRAIVACQTALDRVKFRDPDEWRTPACAEETLRRYVDTYQSHDPICPIVSDGQLFIEQPFSLTIGEVTLNAHIAKLDLFVRKLTILWSGRIDIAAHYGDANAYVVDHKTTSMGGVTFFGDFMLSQQMVGYNWALRKMLPQHNIVGTVVNAIIQRKPSKTGKSLEFSRQVYFHADWHVDEWKRDVLSEIERFLSCLVDGYFPKATKWCFGKYGQCPYHDVCTLPPHQREIMLNSSEYVNVTWSPLAPR
jgi:hypothetical protein